jgi:hypothetical protein
MRMDAFGCESPVRLHQNQRQLSGNANTHTSAAGWIEPITNVLNHSLFIVFNEIKNLFLNMQD